MKNQNIGRAALEDLEKRLFKGKAIIILGPRQVGKTTLAEHLLEKFPGEYISLNADEADVRKSLSNISLEKLKKIIGNKRILCIDEAQRVENIGLLIKIVVDKIKTVQVIATGSSALELNETLKEPLTGRKYEYYLYPFSFEEMVAHHGLFQEKKYIEERLIYGYYPEIVMKNEDKAQHLKLLADSYLYKDLLVSGQMSNVALLEKILLSLALQIGSEISIHELAQNVSSNSHTVRKYIHLLEQCFVLFSLSSFSKNMRNELKKSQKIYFWDNGIRNAIVGNFQDIHLRTDKGALWENFLISERRKFVTTHHSLVKSYFWRTTQQQEIDYVEERADKLSAWEFKFKSSNARIPLTFTNNYPKAQTAIIDIENFDEFLLKN